MRVLVCRPRAESEALAATLIAAGHVPVIAPVLAIETLPVALPEGVIDALVLTSRHAVDGLGQVATAHLRDRPVFAVGDATARAARTHGLADVRVGRGDASSLADLVTLTLKPQARLLYLAGRVRKDLLADALQRRGFSLAIRESYDARPCGPWAQPIVAALRVGTIDACLHFSRRSAELALAAGIAASADFLVLRHVCLSADAAAPLVSHGAPRVSVADRPSEDSLLQALAATLG